MFPMGQGVDIQSIRCPYDPNHFMPKQTFLNHVNRCKAKNKNDFSFCPYNVYHIIRKTQFQAHLGSCPNQKQYSQSNSCDWDQSHIQQKKQVKQQRIKININQNRILTQSIVKQENQFQYWEPENSKREHSDFKQQNRQSTVLFDRKDNHQFESQRQQFSSQISSAKSNLKNSNLNVYKNSSKRFYDDFSQDYSNFQKDKQLRNGLYQKPIQNLQLNSGFHNNGYYPMNYFQFPQTYHPSHYPDPSYPQMMTGMPTVPPTYCQQNRNMQPYQFIYKNHFTQQDNFNYKNKKQFKDNQSDDKSFQKEYTNKQKKRKKSKNKNKNNKKI